MGWSLWLRGRPRCARAPFEPAPEKPPLEKQA